MHIAFPRPLTRSEPAPDIAARYAAIRAASEALAAPLSPEDCALQSMPDASPVKWHLAHTAWFFETFLLAERLPEYRPFHAQFRMLFNSYYNAVGTRHPRPERGLLSRPTLAEVRAYRAHVDEHMERLIARTDDAEALALIELGLQHEQQHQELILTDTKHLFWRNPLRPAYAAHRPAPHIAAQTQVLDWSAHPGGVVPIGADSNGFHFDNEAPRHEALLAPHALATRLTTNAEYLAFIGDGGYLRPELWLSDGWDAVCAQRWEAPLYWERQDAHWSVFTLAGMQLLDASESVCHVSYYEAEAYARWAGARLPTEMEWEAAAGREPVAGNFVESGALHPLPATHGTQMYGDVWEWTGSAYLPYPGYRTMPGAVGEYNGKFMANQFVLRGGSCATPRSHLRAAYRNFFPPAARWQFSGIRLARDA